MELPFVNQSTRSLSLPAPKINGYAFSFLAARRKLECSRIDRCSNNNGGGRIPLSLPLIIEPEQLQGQLGTPGMLIVDLCKPEIYAQSHIPGAVHLEYHYLVAPKPPAMGCLPSEAQLTQVLSTLGVSDATSVVAYDDEGGGRASRLL